MTGLQPVVSGFFVFIPSVFKFRLSYSRRIVDSSGFYYSAFVRSFLL